jgi:hypothetical protein
MANLDREQLEALRRQVEEDYRLDLAAIERLQRRFIGANTNTSSVNIGTISEIRGAALPAPEPQAQPDQDELTGTLRSMFSSHRR